MAVQIPQIRFEESLYPPSFNDDVPRPHPGIPVYITEDGFAQRFSLRTSNSIPTSLKASIENLEAFLVTIQHNFDLDHNFVYDCLVSSNIKRGHSSYSFFTVSHIFLLNKYILERCQRSHVYD